MFWVIILWIYVIKLCKSGRPTELSVTVGLVTVYYNFLYILYNKNTQKNTTKKPTKKGKNYIAQKGTAKVIL